MISTETPISDRLQCLRQFFATQQTQSLTYRIEQLQKLKNAIRSHESAILTALESDLGKPVLEAYLAEFRASLSDVDYALKNIKSWVKPKRVSTSLMQFPAKATIQPEPLGVVLIISPWNYPFSLMMQPLIGAIAAGNCVVLKPSEIALETSKLIHKLIANTFSPEYITVIEGGVDISQALLAEKFDHIFFTGGTEIGRQVMQAAAHHLTPVTLELGGKSPCIVEDDVNLKETAKRIVWGKFLNAGQTCIAPDYLFVKRSIKQALIQALQETITDYYGENPAESPDYARIVSDRHLNRLTTFLQEGTIMTGGDYDAENRYFAPTLMIDVPLDAPAMQEEIFGPILPILAYDNLNEAIAFINQRPKPLALYLFSNDTAKQEQILMATSSGGVCFNDTIMQVGVTDLPFGGVGQSGIGAYHGKTTFETFSHQKSVLRRYFQLEFNLRFPPYQDKINLFKKFLG